jgi:K+-sensing histidine kinase KdpD
VFQDQSKPACGYLITRISDLGHGIEDNRRDDIFCALNPGLKTSNDGQFTTSGVGIGLTTSRNLVLSQGGEIYL